MLSTRPHDGKPTTTSAEFLNIYQELMLIQKQIRAIIKTPKMPKKNGNESFLKKNLNHFYIEPLAEFYQKEAVLYQLTDEYLKKYAKLLAIMKNLNISVQVDAQLFINKLTEILKKTGICLSNKSDDQQYQKFSDIFNELNSLRSYLHVIKESLILAVFPYFFTEFEFFKQALIEIDFLTIVERLPELKQTLLQSMLDDAMFFDAVINRYHKRIISIFTAFPEHKELLNKKINSDHEFFLKTITNFWRLYALLKVLPEYKPVIAKKILNDTTLLSVFITNSSDFDFLIMILPEKKENILHQVLNEPRLLRIVANTPTLFLNLCREFPRAKDVLCAKVLEDTQTFVAIISASFLLEEVVEIFPEQDTIIEKIIINLEPCLNMLACLDNVKYLVKKFPHHREKLAQYVFDDRVLKKLTKSDCSINKLIGLFPDHKEKMAEKILDDLSILTQPLSATSNLKYFLEALPEYKDAFLEKIYACPEFFRTLSFLNVFENSGFNLLERHILEDKPEEKATFYAFYTMCTQPANIPSLLSTAIKDKNMRLITYLTLSIKNMKLVTNEDRQLRNQIMKTVNELLIDPPQEMSQLLLELQKVLSSLAPPSLLISATLFVHHHQLLEKNAVKIPNELVISIKHPPEHNLSQNLP